MLGFVTLIPTVYADHITNEYASTGSDYYKIGDFFSFKANTHEIVTFEFVNEEFHKSYRMDPRGNVSITMQFPSEMPKGIYDIVINYGNTTKIQQIGYGETFEGKKFTINTDKQKYAFGDRVLLTGFLKGYTSASIYESVGVNIQILDENKKQLQSTFYSDSKTAVPSLYEFKLFPRNGDGYATTQNIVIDDLGVLKPYEYRTSFHITNLDFIANMTYHVIATYGKEKIETSFVIYDKFAHMTDIIEVYLKNIKSSLGDTVTITGLAPYANEGGGSSHEILHYNQQTEEEIENNQKSILRDESITVKKRDKNSQTRDNSYAHYTISLPNDEKKTGIVKIENGEFTIEYDISEYEHIENNIEKYSIEIQWSSYYQYLDFVVEKPLKEYNRVTYYDNVHDCEAQIEFIESHKQAYQNILDSAELLDGFAQKTEFVRAENYKIENVYPYQLTEDCK